MFTLAELRTPKSKQSKELKAKIERLRRLHKKIDEDFLNNRVEPRLIVVIAEGVDLKNYRPQDADSWEPQHFTNITVNLNKYIAKYDYDIANVLHPSNAKRTAEDERNFRKTAVYEIL